MTSSRPSSSAELERFHTFCERFGGLQLEPFQHEIVRAHWHHRETLALLPRGNGKTSLAAALAVYHLLTTRRPAVYIGAASRDQARICFEGARDLVRSSPALERHVTVRYRELRAHGGHLRVLSSDGPRAHGLQPTLAIVDELHAHRDAELYVALRTALGKLPGSRLLTISTAGFDVDSVLGRLRARALALEEKTTDGPLTTAIDRRGSFALLEWACPEDADLSDPKTAKTANPASWVTEEWLAEQIHAPGVHPLEFARYHANVWTDVDAAWLPQGAWQALYGSAELEDGETLWAGVDIGGERSGTAVATVTDDGRVHADVWQGDEAVLLAAGRLRELHRRYRLAGVAYDPWRFQTEAQRLQTEGIPMIKVPQSAEAMTLASERFYASIVQGELRHDGDPVLARHIAGATAKSTPRGWRLVRAERSKQIDATIALAMANSLRLAPRPAAPAFVGWL
jgi:phage terminase large subunit-like protein